jgi:EAL domain-containing protein (putative c-di-GMP-specific phosphodiesterase class I)
MTAIISLDELRGALGRGELLFHYQPQVSMVLGTITGAEALIRWNRRDGSLVAPNAFIPLAESTGFIREITASMLKKLVVDLPILHAVDPTLTVSFNTSALDFEGDHLVGAIARYVDQGLIGPNVLEVELTESAVLASGPGLAERLGVLRRRGVTLAMDDFGTGYSSIDTLSKLPFTTLKIDQGIVRRMEASAKDASIVESSIRMAHRLGFGVIAEGIETEACYLHLQAAGCATGQGYWMGRPMPLDDLIELLRCGKRWPAGALGLVHMAALDHLEWRKALLDALLAGGGPIEAAVSRVELDPTLCRLGRWYHGAGRVLCDERPFRDLLVPHADLHDCAARIIRGARAGGSIEELLPSMRELTEHSTRIIALLQEIEHGVLTRMVRIERTRATVAAVI